MANPDPTDDLARRLGLTCRLCIRGERSVYHEEIDGTRFATVPCDHCSGAGIDTERVEMLRQALEDARREARERATAEIEWLQERVRELELEIPVP